jgi:hypothetical protein
MIPPPPAKLLHAEQRAARDRGGSFVLQRMELGSNVEVGLCEVGTYNTPSLVSASRCFCDRKIAGPTLRLFCLDPPVCACEFSARLYIIEF